MMACQSNEANAMPPTAIMQSYLFSYGSQMANKNIGLIVSSASSGIIGVVSDCKRLVPDGKYFSQNLWISISAIRHLNRRSQIHEGDDTLWFPVYLLSNQKCCTNPNLTSKVFALMFGNCL